MNTQLDLHKNIEACKQQLEGIAIPLRGHYTWIGRGYYPPGELNNQGWAHYIVHHPRPQPGEFHFSACVAPANRAFANIAKTLEGINPTTLTTKDVVDILGIYHEMEFEEKDASYSYGGFFGWVVRAASAVYNAIVFGDISKMRSSGDLLKTELLPNYREKLVDILMKESPELDRTKVSNVLIKDMKSFRIIKEAPQEYKKALSEILEGTHQYWNLESGDKKNGLELLHSYLFPNHLNGMEVDKLKNILALVDGVDLRFGRAVEHMIRTVLPSPIQKEGKERNEEILHMLGKLPPITRGRIIGPDPEDETKFYSVSSSLISEPNNGNYYFFRIKCLAPVLQLLPESMLESVMRLFKKTPVAERSCYFNELTEKLSKIEGKEERVAFLNGK